MYMRKIKLMEFLLRRLLAFHISLFCHHLPTLEVTVHLAAEGVIANASLVALVRMKVGALL